MTRPERQVERKNRRGHHHAQVRELTRLGWRVLPSWHERDDA